VNCGVTGSAIQKAVFGQAVWRRGARRDMQTQVGEGRNTQFKYEEGLSKA
jgi:hypothetical protein